MNQNWSRSEIETALREWSNGLSASMIGKIIGRSRGAVLGRLNRLKKRGTEIETRAAKITLVRVAALKKPKPEKPKPALALVKIGPAAFKMKSLPSVVLPRYQGEFEGAGVPLDMQIGNGCWQTLNQAEPRQAHLYCTRSAMTGKHFCEHHYGLIYQAPKLKAA